jgi:hypothetical protein
MSATLRLNSVLSPASTTAIHAARQTSLFDLCAARCRLDQLLCRHKTALGDLVGRLDPDPLRRGTQFERICEWFLTHDPV